MATIRPMGFSVVNVATGRDAFWTAETPDLASMGGDYARFPEEWRIIASPMPETMRELYEGEVGNAFGAAFDSLTDSERALFVADVAALAQEDGLLAFDAARAMRRRIGGSANLASYVDCLVVGRKRQIREVAR